MAEAVRSKPKRKNKHRQKVDSEINVHSDIQSVIQCNDDDSTKETRQVDTNLSADRGNTTEPTSVIVETKTITSSKENPGTDVSGSCELESATIRDPESDSVFESGVEGTSDGLVTGSEKDVDVKSSECTDPKLHIPEKEGRFTIADSAVTYRDEPEYPPTSLSQVQSSITDKESHNQLEDIERNNHLSAHAKMLKVIDEGIEIAATPSGRRPNNNKSSSTSDTEDVCQRSVDFDQNGTHLYPELKAVHSESEQHQIVKMKPFTPEQLASLYYNYELHNNDTFIDDFLKVIMPTKEEFYEILLSYYRSCNNLANSEHDLEVLKNDYQKYKDLVWQMKEETKVVKGQCTDEAKVMAEVRYTKAYYSDTAFNDLKKLLADIRMLLHEQYSLYSYETQLSRLQVKSYLYKMYTDNAILTKIPENSPVEVFLHRQLDVGHQIQKLKNCLGVLFFFLRKPSKSEAFTKDCQTWTKQLTATLLRVATVEDHLYIVNQLLRCPAGIGTWAADCLQCPLPALSKSDKTNLFSPLLDHYVTVLATILQPIRQREDVLYQLKAAATLEKEEVENPWIMVDSDGGEDDESEYPCHYLLEDDIMALLDQLPLSAAFKHLLLFERDDKGRDVCDISEMMENTLLRLFAFATSLIFILSGGLRHFSQSRYRQLNKKLGKMVLTVTLFMSGLWEKLKKDRPQLPSETKLHLQLEYDMLVYRAVVTVLSGPRLGSWQFLADLPYHDVSIDYLWRILLVMHEKCYHDDLSSKEDDQLMSHTLEECQEKLQDIATSGLFEQRLMNMPACEAVYLLTTFSNMAKCRSYEDTSFIKAVTKEIYDIAYIKNHTRQLCSKQGRDLLASIIHFHPHVLSDLLKFTMATIDQIGMVALYLYKDLPIQRWSPDEEDMDLLRDSLINNPLSSAKHQLARHILSQLNWTFNNKSGQLFLDKSLHLYTAIMLVEVYNQHLTGRNVGSLVTEGIKQVASLVLFQETEEQQLANWIWEIAQRLSLHCSQCLPESSPEEWLDVSDLYDDVSLQPIAVSAKDGMALATYLGLLVSKLSHNVADFCEAGVDLLTVLTSKCHYLPALRILHCVLPLFSDKEQYLLSNERFLQVIQTLMQADVSKRALFSGIFPGPVTKLITGLVQSQLANTDNKRRISVVTLWIRLIFKITNWNSDRDCLFIVDKIIEMVFRIPEVLSVVEELLDQAFHGLLTKDKQASVLSSLSTLFGVSDSLPSLIETEHCAEFPWFAYIVLKIETSYEIDESHFWLCLQQHLTEHPDCQLDAATQAVCSKLKLHMRRPVPRLPIYRWMYQALNMEISHPVLALTWQWFYILYLGRLNTKPGLPQRGSIGERFFQSSTNISLMKKLKKQLNDTVRYYQQKAVDGKNKDEAASDEKLTFTADYSASMKNPQNDEQNLSLLYSKFYMTLLFWLDEPHLHDGSLYLPALPPQYDSNRLLQVFQNNKKPWLEMVDFNMVDEELFELANDWNSFITSGQSHKNLRHVPRQEKTDAERILYVLKHSPTPKEPPQFVVPEAAIPVIGDALLCDEHNLIFTLSADFSLLAEYSKVYCQRASHIVAINNTFLELLATLYTNETTETSVSAVCKSTFNPTHKCSGAALLVCQHESAKRNDIIHRKIEENRAAYNQLLIELELPFPQNVCKAAVHVENAITNLIKLLHKKPDDRLCCVGSALFYKVISFVSEDTKYYPPTCQFFSSCIEILGQEFIRNNPTQSMPLLEAVLKHSSIVGLLAPNFTPCASPDLFVSMYQRILDVPYDHGPDVAVTLLTKFELETWLNTRPPLSMRENLLTVIGVAVCRCGPTPDNNLSSVFPVYRIHLRHLLLYQFPDHFGSVLKLILKASASEELSADIWRDFIQLLGCQVLQSDPSNVTSSATPRLINQLSCDVIKETLRWMSSYFLGLRLASSDLANFGLYPKWKQYVPYLADMLNALLKKIISDLALTAATRACDTEFLVCSVWQTMTDVFAPWILPVESANQLLSPWIQDDCESANRMVDTWTSAVNELQIQFQDVMPIFGQHALNLAFPHYVNWVAKKTVPTCVVDVYDSNIINLTWQRYLPGIQEVDLMLQFCTSEEYHRNKTVACHVFSSINWTQLICYYTQHELEEIRRRLLVCYFSLLVRLCQEPRDSEKTAIRELLDNADRIDWNDIDSINYQSVVQWFVENVEAKCVLAERGSSEAAVLRFLKVVSGFVVMPYAAFSQETPHKRCTFLRCVVQLICKCSQLKDVNPECFQILISNLLTDTEAIVATVREPGDQFQQAVSLCTEVLGVLNHTNPQSTSVHVLSEALVTWISDSVSSPLLLPMLSAACCGLASIKHMVTIIETCMDVYFLSDVSQVEGAGWASLLAILQVPDLDKDKFITEALTQGCYLLLYGYILQQLPLSQSVHDEMECIGRLVFWTMKAKPSSSNEAKLLLWLNKILELVPRQLDFEGDPRKVIEKLVKLINALVSLGEDKSHSGLLGAIGLGRKSQLSLRFRVVANAIATFLALQILSETEVRQDSTAPLHTFQQATSVSPTKTQQSPFYSQGLNCLQRLNHMSNDKQYASFFKQIEYSLSFCHDPSHSIKHACNLLYSLKESIFPNINYLTVIQKPS